MIPLIGAIVIFCLVFDCNWDVIVTICNLLVTGSFAETEHGQVTFPEINTTILEKICQYFYWSLQYARSYLTFNLNTINYCYGCPVLIS